MYEQFMGGRQQGGFPGMGQGGRFSPFGFNPQHTGFSPLQNLMYDALQRGTGLDVRDPFGLNTSIDNGLKAFGQMLTPALAQGAERPQGLTAPNNDAGLSGVMSGGQEMGGDGNRSRGGGGLMSMLSTILGFGPLG